MKNKSKAIVFTIAILLLLIVSLGITYAMYTYVGMGSKENVITTGSIIVSYAESNVVNLTNTYPMSDALGIENTNLQSELNFTVTGTIIGNTTINYVIGLDEIVEGATLKDDYLKIYMFKGNTVVSTFTQGEGRTIASIKPYAVDNVIDNYALYVDSFTNQGTTNHSYTIKAWVSEDYNLPGENEVRDGNEINKETLTETFSFKVKVVAKDSAMAIVNRSVLDTSGANEPDLATGMIPVYYDSTNNVWRKADITNTNASYQWYDYDDRMWANAVTVSEVGGSRADLIEADNGTEIPMNRINTMLVWIPRFTINTGGLSTQAYFESRSGEVLYGGYLHPEAVAVEFVDSNTTAHDAFTFGEQNLSGYWVGKFELSSDVECIPEGFEVGEGCNLASINPKIIPNAKSWGGAQISIYYNRMLAMKSDTTLYGFNTIDDVTLDTHMIKNNEWGAVTYLSLSNYGRCVNDVCSEIGINHNDEGITGYGVSIEHLGDDATYETAMGQTASTTGNIYGIYDMSGGTGDYVMGMYNADPLPVGITDESGFSSDFFDSEYDLLVNPKYYNSYTTSTDYTTLGLQHSLLETQNWYNEVNNYFVEAECPWLVRGGNYLDSSTASMFYYECLLGSADSAAGSRLVVTK